MPCRYCFFEETFFVVCAYIQQHTTYQRGGVPMKSDADSAAIGEYHR